MLENSGDYMIEKKGYHFLESKINMGSNVKFYSYWFQYLKKIIFVLLVKNYYLPYFW